MDRISDLTEDVLSYTLSKLSIKDTLKTSVLSRRWWSNLWSLGKDLNFDRHNMLGSEKELLEAGYVVGNLDTDLGRAEFVKRVDQFVKNFRGTEIDSFKLGFNLNCEQSSSIDQWISIAISRGVKRIDLLLSYSMNFFVKWGPFITLPLGRVDEYLNFAIWRARRIDGNIFGFMKGLPMDIGTVRKFYRFPFGLFSESNASNLRSLKLDEARVDETLMTSMISNCLQLEELKLESCMFESSTLKIASSSLRHLEVALCFYISNEEKFAVKLSSLDCPKLTSCEFHRCSMDSLSINTPKLKRIDYSYKRKPSEAPNALALFATLPQLQILALSTDVEVFSLRGIGAFKHLRELNLVCTNLYNSHQGIDTLWILIIIRASPRLQKLSVEEDIKDHGIFSHDELKVVEMGGCCGNWYETELAVNVLKYVHNLDRLVLSPYSIRGRLPDDAWFQKRREMVREELQCLVVGPIQLLLI